VFGIIDTRGSLVPFVPRKIKSGKSSRHLTIDFFNSLGY
jgi:hypothetical protein